MTDGNSTSIKSNIQYAASLLHNMVKQDRRSTDAIVDMDMQWLLMSILLQNAKQKSHMNEIMNKYLNVQIFKCLNI